MSESSLVFRSSGVLMGEAERCKTTRFCSEVEARFAFGRLEFEGVRSRRYNTKHEEAVYADVNTTDPHEL